MKIPSLNINEPRTIKPEEFARQSVSTPSSFLCIAEETAPIVYRNPKGKSPASDALLQEDIGGKII